MKTITLIALCILCSCAPKPKTYPVLHLLHIDRNNNRVDQQGNLIPWTNFGIGYFDGTNWIQIFGAKEE